MADQKVILAESKEQLIEKWLPVIEGTGKWEKAVDGAPKVAAKDYSILAHQLEVLEQVELKESTGTSAVDVYKPVLIPMVRRIAPALIAGRIFGTQPMSGPSGMIFALKSLYTNDSNNPIARGNGQILILTSADAFGAGDTIAGEGSGVGVIRHKEGNAVLVDVSSGTFTTGQNVDENSVYSSALTTVAQVYSNAEALASVIFSNYSGSYSTAAGEALGKDTKEMGFEIVSSEVAAKTRKLKAKWTNEVDEDLRTVHGLNAEQLLSGICSAEISREMNQEFIAQVKTYAAATADNGLATASWTYNTNDDTQGRYENEKYLALCNEISRQQLNVATASLRGMATFMIVTKGVLTALKATGKLNTSGVDPLVNTFVGTFEGMDVFVDLWDLTGTDSIHFGYKGVDEIDAGMFYCPYSMLKVNKGVGEDDNIPRLFFSTRYGLTGNPFGANNYYHKLIINNLPG